MELIFDGRSYRLGPVPFSAVYDGASDQTSYVSEERIKVTMLCEHCRNFRLDQMVLYTVEELIEHGWVIPMEVRT